MSKKAIAKKRKAKARHLTDKFVERNKDAGRIELRSIKSHDDDVPYLDALIQMLNEKRDKKKQSDNDIVFRIDNFESNYSLIVSDSIKVMVNRERVTIPLTNKSIQPGKSLIIRRGDLKGII